MKGIVIKSTGSWYTIKSDGGESFQCRIKGKLRLKGIKSTNPVAVGDWVDFELEGEDEGVIYGVTDRKNYIVRRSVNLSKQTHIIAANLDQAILVITLDFPKTYLQFIDRFLVTAEAYGIPAVLVFNKVDLYNKKLNEELNNHSSMYQKIGHKVLHTSVKENRGLEKLKQVLTNKVSLLSGHSGVGKSSLINVLEPDLDLKTKTISKSHQQGQHTTTFAEMHPLSFGGSIVDTPGIKGFGLVNMEKEEIGDYFPEIFELKGNCKFHNCMHLEEPHCAIKEAVEMGEIASSRYHSYQVMVEGSDDDQYRNEIYE